MEDLARQYMDLWQEHLNTLASDQNRTKVMAQTMAMMTSGPHAFVDSNSASFRPTPEGGDDSSPNRPPSITPPDGNAAIGLLPISWNGLSPLAITSTYT